MKPWRWSSRISRADGSTEFRCGQKIEDRLSFFNQAPCGRDHELTVVGRERLLPLAFGRCLRFEVAGDEGLVLADGHRQAGVVASPFDKPEPLLGRPPVFVVQAVGLIAGNPSDEVVELIAWRGRCRKAHNAPGLRVGSHSSR